MTSAREVADLVRDLSLKVDKRHEEMSAKVDTLAEKVTTNIAQCGLCRPIVMGGNGEKKPIKDLVAEQGNRITALETTGGIRSRAVWMLLGGAVTAAFTVGPKILGWW